MGKGGRPSENSRKLYNVKKEIATLQKNGAKRAIESGSPEYEALLVQRDKYEAVKAERAKNRVTARVNQHVTEETDRGNIHVTTETDRGIAAITTAVEEMRPKKRSRTSPPAMPGSSTDAPQHANP